MGAKMGVKLTENVYRSGVGFKIKRKVSGGECVNRLSDCQLVSCSSMFSLLLLLSLSFLIVGCSPFLNEESSWKQFASAQELQIGLKQADASDLFKMKSAFVKLQQANSDEEESVIKEQEKFGQQNGWSANQRRSLAPLESQLQVQHRPAASNSHSHSHSSIPFTKKYAILGNSTTNPHSSLSHRISNPLVAHHYHSSKIALNNHNQNINNHNHKHNQNTLVSHQHQQQNILLQQQQLHLSEQSHRKPTGLLEKICIGTSNSLAIPQNKSDHYQNLIERYENCTYVIGNLEITWLNDDELNRNLKDLSFLESIREITGYLLISHVDIELIRMPNLQIIRGRDLFKLNGEEHSQEGRAEEFAMILIENELKQLQLPNLREILAGSVGSYNNRNLCHIRTINWDEILNWPMYRSVFVYDGTEPECPVCDASCQGSCWGRGAEMCQKFSKVSCSAACGNNGRCFGPSHTECCHSFCAGGCTGSNQTDCLACKNFYDDGSCIQECPSMMRYNPSKFLWEPNPQGKYAFGATCVRECPENMLRDSGACVRTCPPNKRSFNGECVPCAGPCAKNCTGVELVHSGNIDQLINCTVIEGSITILDESFTGYMEPMQVGAGGTNSSANGALLTVRQQTTPTTSNQTAALSLYGLSISNNDNNNNNNNYNNSASATSSQVQSGLQNGTMVRHKPMHPSRLEVFKTLREITGYLNIKAKHPDFKDLSYFTNLRTINGRQTTDMFHTLSISRTSLVSLNLRSLREIKGGKIVIEENPELCFADTIDWAQIGSKRSEDVSIRNNAVGQRCRSRGLQCNEQCARDGCWGPGPDECLSCNNYKVDDYCVANCSSTESLFGFLAYQDPTQARSCKRCHPECAEGCTGTEARHCHRCKSVKDGPYCVPECPIHKYNRNGTCEECDRSCGPDGCTGPSKRLGEGGCNSCAKAIIKPINANQQSPVPSAHFALGNDISSAASVASPLALVNQQPIEVECIRAEEACPDGFYQEYVLGSTQPDGSPLKSSSGRPVCRKCHHRCKHCIGMGTHKTVCECAKYVAGEQCEDFCPRDFYADEESRQCIKCSPECNGCFGPTEADCISCRVYRIYYGTGSSETDSETQQQDAAAAAQSANQSASSRQPRFNCTAQCPSDKPPRISESNMLDPYCSEYPGGLTDHHIKSSLIVSLGSSSMVWMMLVVTASVMVCLSIHRFQKEKEKKKFKLTMHLSGIEDVEPLTPSHMKPNLAPLRSIKETELRKGHQLGSGFGGTVYQGLWSPEGQEQYGQRPVAIKVLRDNGQPNMNKEFLDEAYIMASVNHPNLVRLLAVCMTPSHLMLVTQLMPLGCLLDYVKKNRRKIGSKNLLEWGKQIARGMAYLEENRMVHRDLALRNVLLQTPGRALISDFGLAKLLELDQSEYQSGEGRLPIKWLAPECLRNRKFTHKSDVWAFGVTVWELVTFGKRPFDEYETRDVPLAIEKGARLQQPGHVSTELYKVMYACWFYNPEDRPDFKQLAQNFIKFARDPERFIICGSKGMELCQEDGGKRLDRFEDFHPSTTSDEDQDAEDEEEELDEDFKDEDGQCLTEPSSSLNGTMEIDNQSPASTIAFSQQPTPNTLTHQPDLTPSTHNRLNTMFGFELKRHHRSIESSNSVMDEQHKLNKPANVIGVDELLAREQQQQQHLLNHHHHHHNHHHHQLNSRSMNKTNLMDANNNDPLMTDNNNNSNGNNNGDSNSNNLASKQHNRIPKNSVSSCWSMHHTMSTNSLGQRSEQPTDVYDYLLPSPCTDEHGNAFGSTQFYPTPSSYQTNHHSHQNSQQSHGVTRTLVANNRGHLISGNTNPPLSAGLINNEEYFLSQANYVNNQDAGPFEYHQVHQQRHHSLSQRLSTSSGDVPQSLV